MRCQSCHEPGTVELGQPRQATVGTVAGILERVPLVRCRSGHDEPATARPEIADLVVQSCREAIPEARRRLLGRDICTSCRAPLSMPVRRTGRVVSIDGIDEVPVLTLRFDLPMTRCPACGLDQLPTRSRRDLTEVLERLTAGPADDGS